jgi:hypothetical protein
LHGKRRRKEMCGKEKGTKGTVGNVLIKINNNFFWVIINS